MDSSSNAIKAIQAVNSGLMAYCKFLSANDTGETNAHQEGIYIAKKAVPILFDEPGVKGENKERFVNIIWQDDFPTESRFIYYGFGTRNEYRITRFGRGFPFLRKEDTGDLFVLVKMSSDEYSGYMLQTEDEINDFLGAFNLSPTDTGKIIQREDIRLDAKEELAIIEFLRLLKVDFPSSMEMSNAARRIYNEVYEEDENIICKPDRALISWIDMEYAIFRKIEHERYRCMIERGFSSVEQFIEVANMVLNRRKSRAGKSLEHHLEALFGFNSLKYTAQPRTEGNKHPDFIFPGESEYHDRAYPAEKLVFLGAKTTCKDRWRQVINEAKRIRHKHLFTLQQGISTQQLDEMEQEGVTLVVPQQYLATFPEKKREYIWTLRDFIAYAKEKAGA